MMPRACLSNGAPAQQRCAVPGPLPGGSRQTYAVLSVLFLFNGALLVRTIGMAPGPCLLLGGRRGQAWSSRGRDVCACRDACTLLLGSSRPRGAACATSMLSVSNSAPNTYHQASG